MKTVDDENRGLPAGGFDPIPILRQTDSMISVQDALFMYELAIRTRASGW